MGKMRNLIGERIENMEIVSCRNYQDIDVQFDNGYIAKNVQYMNFKKTNIKDLFKKEVKGVGYLGGVERNGKAYACWSSMLQRCYDDKRHITHPTYIGCTVDEEWHNFQNFRVFYEKNYKKGYHLDKDLMNIGNKIYSEKNCSFVPREINMLLAYKANDSILQKIGVNEDRGISRFRVRITIEGKRKCIGVFNTIDEAYSVFKIAKEDSIKNIANKYKEIIDIRIYENLINYTL
jgi:hypothetical protein